MKDGTSTKKTGATGTAASKTSTSKSPAAGAGAGTIAQKTSTFMGTTAGKVVTGGLALAALAGSLLLAGVVGDDGDSDV